MTMVLRPREELNEAMDPFNVHTLAAELLATARGSSAGRAAHMPVGGPDTEMTQAIIALVGGFRLDEHENPGEATILVLTGEVELGSGESVWAGLEGDLLDVPRARHHLLAKTDSTVLLTSVKRRSGLTA
jgi:quercetin dioxygenase-like cupin family protein